MMMMALRNPLHGAVEASTRLARLWGARIAHLKRLLSLHPDHDEAWWWRVRLKINQYLLARYGEDRQLREYRPVQRADASPIAVSEEGSAPRAGAELRQMMGGLVQINRQRRSLDADAHRHELIVRLFEVFEHNIVPPEPIVSDVDGLSLDFMGLHWFDISADTFERRAAQLHRFGPVALAYHLPGFLRYGLLNPGSEAALRSMRGLTFLADGRLEKLKADQCLLVLECVHWILLGSLAEEDMDGFANNQRLLRRVERSLIRQAALLGHCRLKS